MKNINKNNGITIVALIVTIILLLILAGIAISQLTGNGIFEKVKQAKQVYENKQEEENAILNNYQEKISLYSNRSDVLVTELLSEPIVVATSTTSTDRNVDATLREDFSNYKMLLFTFGGWNNTNKSLGLIGTQLIATDMLSLYNTNAPPENRLILCQQSGDSYSYSYAWFKDSKTIHIGNTISSNAGRKHFAITSIKGIN